MLGWVIDSIVSDGCSLAGVWSGLVNGWVMTGEPVDGRSKGRQLQ